MNQSRWDEDGVSLHVSKHQRVIVDKAIARLREWVDENVDEGRAVELICIDFLESFEHKQE